MEGYGVELDSLATTGGEFIDLADEAQGSSSELIGGVEAYEGVNDGFTTTSKVGTLAELWDFQIEDLGKRAATAGGLLQDGAKSYKQVEDAVIEHLPSPNSGG